MAHAKVKVTDLATGQQSLLLVRKINIKGLLVQSTHPLPLGTRVTLSLRLSDVSPPLVLNGEVHKVMEKEGNSRGMILRFIDIRPEECEEIEAFVLQIEHGNKGDSQEYKVIPSQHGTMFGSELPASFKTDPKPHLPNPQPVQTPTAISPEVKAPAPAVKPEAKPIKPAPKPTATVDEEDGAELGGETRLLDVAEFEPYLQKPTGSGRKKVLWLLVLIILLAALWFLKDKAPNVSIPTPVLSPTASTTQVPTPAPTFQARAQETAAPRPTSPPTIPPLPIQDSSAPAGDQQLRAISVSETDAFLKITFEGTGPLSEPQISRLMSPKRLVLDFEGIASSSVSPQMALTKNPVLKIRTEKRDAGVRVTLDLYPIGFPRYDIKGDGTNISIYLYR